MKTYKTIIISALIISTLGIVGCNDLLDKEPYDISPTAFFDTQEQLDAYAIGRYGMLGGTTGYSIGNGANGDNDTDNQTAGGSNLWLPGQLRVPSNTTSAGSKNWNWGDLYTINYFFDEVLPKYEAGSISGDMNQIEHYIGEMYFFRALFYYNRLKQIGDAPIILSTLPDQVDPLLKASVRQPRNMVARQILTDLDFAIKLLSATPIGGNNRLGKNVALLFKSRVALYEASWEKNFAGTAFVPNGAGWTGAAAHPNYEYDAAAEINFFLDESLKAAEAVADVITLAKNPVGWDYTNNSAMGNEYYDMFAMDGLGLNSYSEVLLFRSYDKGLGQSHNMGYYIRGGGGTGYNHQYMQNFLMANGLPIYAAGSGYKLNAETEVNDMKIGRDARFQLFVQAPGEILNNGQSTNYTNMTRPVPALVIGDSKSTTGYTIKKRASHDAGQWEGGTSGTIGDIIFRGVEAHLNYIEAYYLKNGSVGGKADIYWRAIRARANVDTDYMKTIEATNMNEEAKVDLAAYTAGQLVDATLYNIRRERRSEFIAEGYRWDDLKRYRAMDQLISGQVFIPQGFNLWEHYYTVKDNNFYENDGTGDLRLKQFPAGGANVSENKDFQTVKGVTMDGKYLYPFRVFEKNLYFNGYTFHPAHYLEAIGVEQIRNATAIVPGENFDISKSVVYQNPGWGVEAEGLPQSIPGFQ